jgi:hypothetical protein
MRTKMIMDCELISKLIELLDNKSIVSAIKYFLPDTFLTPSVPTRFGNPGGERVYFQSKDGERLVVHLIYRINKNVNNQKNLKQKGEKK